MAKVRIFSVKGIGPNGTVMELNLVAETAMEARIQAEGAGLRGVMVGRSRCCDDVDEQPPESGADGA